MHKMGSNSVCTKLIYVSISILCNNCVCLTSIFRQFDNVSGKIWFDFTNYLCVGNVNDVKNCMIEMYHENVS